MKSTSENLNQYSFKEVKIKTGYRAQGGGLWEGKERLRGTAATHTSSHRPVGNKLSRFAEMPARCHSDPRAPEHISQEHGRTKGPVVLPPLACYSART